jgi:hypothetical protein
MGTGLILGNVELMDLQFHSDAEEGLGPVVAGLSLGASAVMHFRFVSKLVNRNEDRRSIILSLRLDHVESIFCLSLDHFHEYEYRAMYWLCTGLIFRLTSSMSLIKLLLL